MERKEINQILLYYAAIPGMLKLLRKEKEDLELEYSSVQAIAPNGGQHGSTPGSPTEKIALQVIENGVSDRLKEIEVKILVLARDAALIRGCMDGMNSEYKRLILMRYVHRYSWNKISARMGMPESTARSWYERAGEILFHELKFVPMADELCKRASRAR